MEREKAILIKSTQQVLRSELPRASVLGTELRYNLKLIAREAGQGETPHSQSGLAKRPTEGDGTGSIPSHGFHSMPGGRGLPEQVTLLKAGFADHQWSSL